MLAFLAVNSSKVKSPPTYALPPTYKSLAKVPIPVKVEAPETTTSVILAIPIVPTPDTLTSVARNQAPVVTPVTSNASTTISPSLISA